jgi:putative alpha-1,2-mannosidase
MPASVTLGFAFNDKAVATMASRMGTAEEYEKYEARSANWLNVWNPENQSEGFCGFPQTRNEDGSFDEGFDPHGGYNSHFYEMTGWDASYVNYNDLGRLIRTMGGAQTFTKRLLWACEHSVNYYNDDDGKEGYLNFTNEPSFHIPWLFCTDEIRRPDLAAKVIDGVIKRFSKQNDYPGDDDNGGMSSYYLFLMCGFFPYATTENYYLHGTRVEEIVFHLGNGKDLRITGENVGEKNIYVQSATWQGKALDTCKLTHGQISMGGELHFVMGEKPSDWAKK